VVVEVNPEPSDFLKYWRSYETSNCFNSTLYKHSSTSNGGRFFTTPKKVGTLKFKKETNFKYQRVLGWSTPITFDHVFFFSGLLSNY